MTDPIRYVVVCACDGKIEPVAYIDDDRSAGGAVTVSGPADTDKKQIIFAPGYHPEIESWRAPDGWVASKWAERNVSEILWDETQTRTGWIVRCDRCGEQQAQMSQSTLERIVDAIDLSQLASVPAPHPVEPQVEAWTEDGWVASEVQVPEEWHSRYVIQLSVLVREAQRKM